MGDVVRLSPAVRWLEKDYADNLAPVLTYAYVGEGLRATRAHVYHRLEMTPGNVPRPMFQIIPDHYPACHCQEFA